MSSFNIFCIQHSHIYVSSIFILALWAQPTQGGGEGGGSLVDRAQCRHMAMAIVLDNLDNSRVQKEFGHCFHVPMHSYHGRELWL